VSELPRRHAASWFVAPAAVAVGVLLVGALARVLAPGARTFADTVGEASLGPLGRLPWDWLPLLGAQLAFVAVALAIEVPVGLVLARALPRRGVGATAAVALLAWPLLVPAAVAGLLAAEAVPRALAATSVALSDDVQALVARLVLDVWRFTPAVALLAAVAARRGTPPGRLAALVVVVRFAGALAALPPVPADGGFAAWLAAETGAGSLAGTTAAAVVLAVLVLLPAMPLRVLREEAR